ncbi:MAG: helix-turn-helix transcriptional regulator [Dehalococcoidia bacterium]
MTAPSPISMRERLRENYAWTPRQREVLDLMSRGKTNTEIGESLGISLDGAKWHVSEILSKLQAESREEAGDYWRRYNGFAPRFGRVFRGIAGGTAVKWVGGATGLVVAGAAATAIVAIAINQSSNEPLTGDPNSPAPIVTPPPAGPGPGSVFNGKVSFGQNRASIPGSTMFVVTGCSQCDGPDETLQAHVTDRTGTTTVTTILRSDAGILAGWTIGALAGSPDASLLAAVVCDQEYCGGMGGGDYREGVNASWRVITSSDQGTTWNTAFTYSGDFVHVTNVNRNSFLALASDYAAGQSTTTYTVNHAGTLEIVSPPTGLAGGYPYVLEDGTTLWANAEYTALYRQDGTPLNLTAPAGSDRLANMPISELEDGTLAIAWAAVTSDGFYSETVQIVDRDGDVKATIDGNATYFLRVLDGQHAIGNVSAQKAGLQDGATSYPVLLDTSSGTATPVTSDALTDQRGRNRFIAFDMQ